MTMKHNNNTRRNFHRIMLTTAVLLSVATVNLRAQAATADDLHRDAAQALKTLYQSHPHAETLAQDARAILVFPRIIKAGTVFDGSYGEGVMVTRNGSFTGHYNSVSAAWDWQAGSESHGYVVFLMNDKSVDFLAKTKAWELGEGPDVVVVDAEVEKSLESPSTRADAYAYVFDQHGLMADTGIAGTKIASIKKR